MEAPGKKDQIYLLMFEPGMAELLYVLLTKREYSAELKEKILKVAILKRFFIIFRELLILCHILSAVCN